MIKRIFIFILCIMSITLTSCIKEKVDVPTKPTIDIAPSEDIKPTEKPTEGTDDLEKIEFKVNLKANGKRYIPKKDEKIVVLWDNLNGEVHHAKIEEDGYARCKGLDGDFFVHLENLPERYTYNPNDSRYLVNPDNPDIEIELKSLGRTRGNGTGLYFPDCYQMSTEGYYRAKVMDKEAVYFEFAPKESGTYIFESLCDAYTGNINPYAYVYIGTSSFKPSRPSEVISSGGFTIKGGFTNNFKLKFSVSDNMIGNVYTFGVRAEAKDKVYPCIVDFLVLNEKDYVDVDPIAGLMQTAKELDKAKITIDYKAQGKKLINADGGQGNYYDKPKLQRTYLDGDYFKYKEDEGIYYYYDPESNTYITPLCVYISAPCPFYPNEPLGSLATIQGNGNKALTVKDRDGNYYDYTNFIEKQYASIANEDGLTYVTKEIKDFLLMYSNSQRLFMDGNGFVEDQFHVMSNGDDQWLFACCYYI